MTLTAEETEFAVSAEGLPLWSDTNPALIPLKLELLSADGTVSDADSLLWGARTVRCEGYRMFLNDRAVYLRGSTEHCYFAETANAPFDLGYYRKILGTLKSAGFNFLRFHTWCPPEPYLTAADELGILVQIEIPHVPEEEAWINIIRLIRRHASVILLCGGNERTLTNERLAELERIAFLCRKMAGGAILFNPQEALPGAEYRLDGVPDVVSEPFPHSPSVFARLAKFSDVYGCWNGVYFSYAPEEFPGRDEMEKRLAVYRKPLLAHEAGILGGYLDLSLRDRYEGTYITPVMYDAAAALLKKHGILDQAELYFRNCCALTALLRKFLIENIRLCPSYNGYDYLGGSDAHWHRCGYPCGVFNEFYELKPGDTLENLLRYNGETVLLCDLGARRTLKGGTEFRTELFCSHFGAAAVPGAVLHWELAGKTVHLSGALETPAIPAGSVTSLGTLAVPLPVVSGGEALCLKIRLGAWENEWDVWLYPGADLSLPANVMECAALGEKELAFLKDGGSVLLTSGGPCNTEEEHFRSCSTGRSLGHHGTILHPHPVWRDFPHQGFASWQFFSMMEGGVSHEPLSASLPFAPVAELIPSYKLVQRKSLLSEYRVGKGRLMICGLKFTGEPAGEYLYGKLLQYLAHPTADVPEIAPELLAGQGRHAAATVTDLAWDPNMHAANP